MSREEADEIQHSKWVSEITPEMIEAGVRAYKREASHDEMSFATPEDVVRAILAAALFAEEMNETDALITRRLIAFYEGMIRRGEIVPAPELLPIVRSTDSPTSSINHRICAFSKAAEVDRPKAKA